VDEAVSAVSGIRLSLCMIVRDEAELLGACLQSVAGAADQMIVVDTGSRDRTAEVARAAGAEVHAFAWCDDFAAARNASVAYARGDWILCLDADERLAPGSAAVIRRAIEAGGFDCGLLRLHNADRAGAATDDVLSGSARLDDPLALPRLLRRTPDLAFNGLVHESVGEWMTRPGRRVRMLDADIIHFGRTSEMIRSRAKVQRDIGLLRLRCAAEPDDVTAFGYLALELWQSGAIEEARRTVDQGWPLLPRQPGHRSVLRLAVARAALQLYAADPAAVLQTVLEAEPFEGAHPDLVYLRGQANEVLALRLPAGDTRRRALLESALTSYREAVAPRPVSGVGYLIAGSNGWAAQTRLGTVLLLLGRPTLALSAFTAALALRPRDVEARLGQVEATLDAGQPERAFALAEPLLNDTLPDGWLLASAIAHALGSLPDARALLNRAAGQTGTRYLGRHRGERETMLAAILPTTLPTILPTR
jgi:tetratricopeptide (TPR) repeat protein